MSDQIELVEDLLATDKEFGFRVRWKYQPHWADVEVFEYTAQDVEAGGKLGRKMFPKKDWHSSSELVYEIDEAEAYLTGFIKWDGCSELDIGCPHWCGPRDYLKHFAILKAIYCRAQDLMESGNDDPWPAREPREQPKCLADANEALRRWDAHGEELPLPTFVAMRDLLMELTMAASREPGESL